MKNVKMRNFARTTLVLGLVMSANNTYAMTSQTNFQVTATVVSACSINATDLLFGNYSGATIDQTNTVTVQCTNGTNWDIALDFGLHAAGTQRNMDNGGNALMYQIYSDAGRTQIWADGTGGTSTVNGTGGGTAQAQLGYGRLPSGQFAPAGNYTDTIQATVTF